VGSPLTDPTWTVDDGLIVYRRGDEDLDYISQHGMFPAQYADLVRCVRDAGLLPAALDVIWRRNRGWIWYDVAACWRRGYPMPFGETERESNPDAVRAVLDLVKDRQP